MPPHTASPKSRTAQNHPLLLDLIAAMGEAPSPETVLRAALTLIGRYGHWNFGEAWVPASDTMSLRRAAALYRPASTAEFADTTASLGDTLPAQVLTTRQSVWLCGQALPSPSPDRLYHTAFAFPILDGTLRAVLVFAKFRAQTENAPLVELMRAAEKPISTALTLKQDEEKQQAVEARLNDIVDLSDNAIIAMNAERRIILFSPGAGKVFGYTASEMIGQPLDVVVRERTPEPNWQPFSANELEAGPAKQVRKVESIGRRKNGEEFPAELAYSSQVVNDELVYMAIVYDVSRRNDDARRLQIYSELLINAHDAIGLTDLNARFTYVNPAFARMTGYSEDELVGMPVTQILDPSQSIEEIVTTVLTHNVWRSEIPLVRKDGSSFYGNVNAFTIKNNRGDIVGLGGIVRDVTDTKLTTERVRQSERLYRTLVHQIPNFAVLVFDEQLRFMLADGEALERQGYQKEAVEGRRLDEVLAPELAGPLKPFYQMTLEGQTMEIDFDLNGSAYNVRFVPLVDDKGDIRNGMVVTNDITSSKRAENEIRSLNQNLERRVAQRTAALEAANKELEAFSYSVSHDLRAPLRSINGFTKFLAEEYAHLLPDEAREYLDIVRETTREMGELINALLSFSRLTRKELTGGLVDVREMLYEVLDELEPDMRNRAIEIRLGTLPACYGDRTLIKQVWTNLISNAVKYTRRRAVAHITLGSQIQNGRVVYFVKDDGVGFDMRFAPKLFGVFQRLHKVEDYEGTGVGLAIVQRIINRHGGQVWTQAAVDQGATFYFTVGLGEGIELE